MEPNVAKIRVKFVDNKKFVDMANNNLQNWAPGIDT